MEEYIKRSELQKTMQHVYEDSTCPLHIAAEVDQYITETPAADVVEVVRCGECERRSKSADLTDTVYCPWLKQQMRKTDFCSYGERRDG